VEAESCSSGSVSVVCPQMDQEIRLTTRWSGPGQGDAILWRRLGRAAQLEAVRRLMHIYPLHPRSRL